MLQGRMFVMRSMYVEFQRNQKLSWFGEKECVSGNGDGGDRMEKTYHPLVEPNRRLEG